MKWNFYRMAAFFLVAAILFSETARAEPVISAQRGILMDADTGRILWERDADAQSAIASTTKIMTGLLVCELCRPEELVTVSPEAVGVEGSSAGLKAGEQLTAEALLYGMLLESGNDAAQALALHLCGSQEAFAAMMNQAARDLGLHHTQFVNPHGLDAEGHYSTARDLAVLTAAAMKEPLFRQVVATKTASFGTRTWTNHNRLLWTCPGVLGVKTGYTRAAGRILVSCARRKGRTLIAVTIRAPRDWEDHRLLLEDGFAGLDEQKLIPGNQILTRVPVINGRQETAAVTTGPGPCVLALARGERAELEYRLRPFVFAPVRAGERAGTVAVKVNGVPLAEYPLYWNETVWEEQAEWKNDCRSSCPAMG